MTSCNGRKFFFLSIWLLVMPGPTESAMVPGHALNNTLTIGYLLSWSHGWVGGPSTASAINLAIEEIHSRGLLPGYRIKWIMEDSYCQAVQGTKVAVSIWSKAADLDVFIGPGCSVACEPVSLLGAAWNIPVVSYGCNSDILSDKTVHPTFTRSVHRGITFAHIQYQVGLLFNWTHYCILSDSVDVFMYVAREMEKIMKSEHKFYFLYVVDSSVASTEGIGQLRKTLKIMKSKCRIVFLLMYAPDVRNVLAVAHEEDMLRNYVYISESAEIDWDVRTDFRPDLGLEIYQGVMDLEVRAANGPAYDAFRQEVIDGLQAPDFEEWPVLGSDAQLNEVSAYAAFIFDSVLMWAYGVNLTLEQGFTPDDGRRVTQNIMSLRFEGIDGPVVVDEFGDRTPNADITIVQNGKSVPLLQYVASLGEIVKIYKSDQPNNWDGILWPGNVSQVPTAVPLCGWNNELCNDSANNKTIIIAAVGSSCLLMLLGIVSAILLLRKLRYQKRMKTATECIIKWDELVDVKLRRLNSHTTLQTAVSSTPQTKNTCKLMKYKNETVAVSLLCSGTLDLSQDLSEPNILLELQVMKELHHENLNMFFGISQDPTNSYLIMAYASRGCVQDVLANEESSLTWDLQVSLIRDIANGMKALHASAIGWHSSLKSSSCLVDSRWVCKITSFGLRQLRQSKADKVDSYLWTSPEILRNENNIDQRKADVYSFGIICLELITRQPPFAEESTLTTSEIVEKVKQAMQPPFRPSLAQESCPSKWLDLMALCWNEDPNARPNFSDILSKISTITGGKSNNFVDTMVKRLEVYSTTLENIVEQRSMELHDEKTKMEHLLRELLPTSIVDSLTLGKQVEPENFESVTVFFSDIVSFTRISAAGTPIDVVRMLNTMYTVFDDISARYDVYKVATIGDAYFVTSGVPIRNGDQHATQICGLATELLEAVSTLPILHIPGEMLKMRIGIHSGSCLAGVVGVKMPRYLLFGDTIDIASAMESGGESMRIHVSNSSALLLAKSQFQLEPREEGCPIKGHGVMETFWLSA